MRLKHAIRSIRFLCVKIWLVRPLFGEYFVGKELAIDVNGGVLRVTRVSDDMVELVLSHGGLVEKKLVSLPANKPMVLQPYPALWGPLAVNCVLIKLDPRVVVKPKETLSILRDIPVDIGVVADGQLLMTAPLSKVKYALYGPSDLGDICRYIDDEITDSAPQWARARAKITFYSVAQDPLEVSRIVVPATGFAVRLPRDGEGLISKISYLDIGVKLYGFYHAEINVGGETQDAETRIIRLLPQIGGVYVMKHGL